MISDFAGNPLSGPVLIRGYPPETNSLDARETNQFNHCMMTIVCLYCCDKFCLWEKWLCWQSTFRPRVYQGSPHGTNDVHPYTITNYAFNGEKNFWCMISDFLGSLLLGSVFIRGPPMKQMIFTLTRWVVYTYTAEINFWCMIIDFSGIISVPKWHYKKFCIEI